MLRRILYLLCLPVLLLACSTSQAGKVTDNKSLLWRISGHGLAKDSYLFGTMHMLCQDDYIWTDSMKKSLKAAQEVCFEMDMDDPAVMQEAMAGIMGSDTDKKADNRALKDYFTAAQYSRLKKFMQDSMSMNEMQLQMFQGMKPMMLEMLFETKTLDCSFPVSYEANIMADAKKDNKQILGLEQAKEQLDLLNGVNDDSAALSIMQMIDSFSATKEQYRQMVASYKQQDLPGLYRQVQGSKELGDDMGAFLDDRNKKWIPRMADKMKDSSVFFAVGAGHLWGDNGVISLLRKAGYTVTPVK